LTIDNWSTLLYSSVVPVRGPT